MMREAGSVMKRAFGMRVLAFIIFAAMFCVESSCRVQAGNPQTSKPVKPGTVTVALADAPVDELSQLFIKIHAVAFAPEGTGRCLKDPARACADSSLFYFELNQETEVDLLSLSDGRTQVLPFSQNLPAGTYEGIRLILVENSPVEGVLRADGSRVPILFPQGPFGRREFTIAEEFDVQEETENEILIHVDLRRSLRRLSEGTFMLSPFTHVVPTKMAARLSGAVSDPDVTRICAYNVGGKRRFDGPRLRGDPIRLSTESTKRHMQGPNRDSMMTDPQGALRSMPGQPDPTSSCDNAEAVSENKNSRYDLRYLPPVAYILRAFKSDGSFTDTPVSVPLRPQEERVLDL